MKNLKKGIELLIPGSVFGLPFSVPFSISVLVSDPYLHFHRNWEKPIQESINSPT